MVFAGIAAAGDGGGGGVGVSAGSSWAACGASDAARSRTKIMAREVMRSISPVVVVCEPAEWDVQSLRRMASAFYGIRSSGGTIIAALAQSVRRCDCLPAWTQSDLLNRGAAPTIPGIGEPAWSTQDEWGA